MLHAHFGRPCSKGHVGVEHCTTEFKLVVHGGFEDTPGLDGEYFIRFPFVNGPEKLKFV